MLPAPPLRSFRDLTVWQRAIELTTAIYTLTRLFPKDELFGLTSQLRRAAVSIPSNIAEGQSRGTTGEFKHFLAMARGSNAELQTQLVIARNLKLITPELLNHAESLSAEVSKMLNALIKTLVPPTDH